MKAIETRYLGPTGRRGSRIVATAEGGNRVTISYDDEWNSEGNHGNAALALCQKLRWSGHLVGGGTGRGMVWVFTDKGAPELHIDPRIWAAQS